MRAEARATLDLAIKEAQPKNLATDKEHLASAERRTKFWRDRCLEHARTIDELHKQIYGLREFANRQPLTLEEINKIDLCTAWPEGSLRNTGVYDWGRLLVAATRAIEKAHKIGADNK